MSQVTKRALEQSLKNLLLKKPLTKITVGDITDDCGINRMTFYYHFKDVYDLLEWIYLNEVIQPMEGKDTYNTWQQGFLSIFEYILNNKEFVRNTYNSISREFFLKFIYNQTKELLMNVIEEKSKSLNVEEENKEFMADFYKYGFVGIVQDWIENGMKENPHDIISKLNNIIDGSFENALENLDKMHKM